MTDTSSQKLHLVFGGELDNPDTVTFRDLDTLDIVGIFPSAEAAKAAWKSRAQGSVDNAHMRYFVVNLDRSLNPDRAD
jgi:hypothetical protein